MDNSNKEQEVTGTVIEALPEATFKILLEDDTEVLGYLAGKMKLYRIKVVIGDKVMVKTDPYGGKARIFKRL
jgi:translation initiation factor IF-1